MSLPLVYALLAWQQPTPAPTAPSVPQPIARVDVKPAEYALQVGDTVRLHAVAYDSSGRAMPEAVIRWFASGGRFEGSVDSTGLVSAGSDRKSTRLNSSHSQISYAVFCLKKKKKTIAQIGAADPHYVVASAPDRDCL